jgi:hypothetical protein
VWLIIFQLTLWTLFTANLFTALVLLALRAYWLSVFLVIISSAILAVFHFHVVSHLERFVKTEPLQAAEAAPRARVPREAYLPAPLRRGAVGWFPEGMKVWEKYGIPRYSTIW